METVCKEELTSSIWGGIFATILFLIAVALVCAPQWIDLLPGGAVKNFIAENFVGRTVSSGKGNAIIGHGSLVTIMALAACFYIWCWAFRRRDRVDYFGLILFIAAFIFVLVISWKTQVENLFDGDSKKWWKGFANMFLRLGKWKAGEENSSYPIEVFSWLISVLISLVCVFILPRYMDWDNYDKGYNCGLWWGYIFIVVFAAPVMLLINMYLVKLFAVIILLVIIIILWLLYEISDHE